MALFKCKMCGGALEVADGATIVECGYCGTQQTLPKLNDEKRANMYDRANHFRRNNEFDKAMGIYEQILNEDNSDAEAYWSIVLCRYGIEYVEDPSSHRRMPTVNRAQFTSIFDDDNYKSALKYADITQRSIYEAEAREINEIQKGILAISQKEEPFDVFICYKESDNHGQRTHDSVLAQDLYYGLKDEGFKVFFARITLENKLGTAYEPYIFAALNSAKVMVVLGTKPEYFNAVWVKNEWSRYLSLIKQGQKKMLIPAYKDMDPYDLPEEFSHLQAQDMSKLGFMQDLIRGIKKIARSNEPKATVVKETVVTNANTNTAPLIKRAFMFLEDGDWESADEYCEKVLDADPENVRAYLGKLMAELHIRKKEQLKDHRIPFDSNPNYRKVLRFADEKLKSEMLGYIEYIKTRNKKEELEAQYQNNLRFMNQANGDFRMLRDAGQRFANMGDYKDAQALSKKCFEKAEAARIAEIERVEKKRKNDIYLSACIYKQEDTVADLEKAIDEFNKILDWKDSQELMRTCEMRMEQLKVEEEQRRIEEERRAALLKIEKEKRAKRNKKIAYIVLVIIVAWVAFANIWNYVIVPNREYNRALDLMEAGQYADAKIILEGLDGFGSSSGKIAIISATNSLKKGTYSLAIDTALRAEEAVTIKYNLNGGTSPVGDKVKYTSLAEYSGLVEPQKEGYKFKEWNFTGYSYSKEDSLIIIFDAVWTDGYTITYDLDGGLVTNPSEYHKEGTSITLKNPTKTGYIFIGWTGTGLDGLTMEVTIPSGSYGDRNYKANWQANEYKFTLDANGGQVSPTTLSAEFNSSYKLPIPTRDYYTFVGWYNGSRKYTDGTWVLAQDLTLKAKWNPITYSIAYNLNGGTNASENPKTFNVETPTITLKEPTKNGYKFLGWYSDSSFNNKVTEIPTGSHQKITLYAKWEIETYTITYNLNGGTVAETLKTTFTINDLPMNLPIPTRTDYVFLGWKVFDENGEDIDSISKCGNITLYASYVDPYLQLSLKTVSSGNNYYIVSGYSGSATIVDIPAYYEGYPVKEIKSSAFANKTQIISINIPSTVTTIGSSAFSGCSSLKTIIIPSGVTKIESSTFLRCKSLTTVSIPDTITSIGSNAFEGCSALKTIKLPSKLSSLGSYAFEDCTMLESIEIPATVETLSSYTFHGCINLSTVILNEGLEQISYNVFTSEKITKLVIPKSVTKIDSSAFEATYSYGSTIPDCNNIAFFCCASTMPSGWQSGWNNDSPIIWAYNESTYQDPTYSFVTNGATDIPSITQTQILEMPIPTRTGYVFMGWYDNSDFSGDPVAFPYYSTTKTTLYAKWLSEANLDGSSFELAYIVTTEMVYTATLNVNGYIYCRFVPLETRTYTISSSNKPKVYCYLYDASGSQLTYDYEYGYGNINISYSMTAGKEYYIMIKPYYSDESATCEFEIK